MNDISILIRNIDPAILANEHIEEEDGKIRVTEHYTYNRCHGSSSRLYSNVVDMSQLAMAEGISATKPTWLWYPTLVWAPSDGFRG